MLDFIGTGSAFNTKLGNNSAYIKKDGLLILIDCGANTFTRIEELNLLDGVDSIHVLITHTHPDHIGSLGDLIFYTYYSMGEMFKRKITIYAHEKHEIEDILTKVGVTHEKYSLVEYDPTVMTCTNMPSVTLNYGDINLEIFPVEVKHSPALYCIGYILKYNGVNIYYSGDCSEIPQRILDSLLNDDIDVFYQDTCKEDYDGNIHLSLRNLAHLIPWTIRSKVHCMHLDKNFDIDEANYLGFNVVESTLPFCKTEA